ncbi:MAG TPA: tRNA epoxyqueuosine(34) reductase QueG, partial [Ignavibacteriaceae bacterium]|nr:tRNA epoxyqueuosine(34) reductase QueG [Ignavibacteriaceae bacterium]
FNLIGFASAGELTAEYKNLLEWISRKYHSGMKYMENNLEKKKDVKKIFPDAKSIISLGMNYYMPGEFENDKSSGKISRYAWGKDYHLVITEKLDKMVKDLILIDPGFRFKYYVDTGPVMDKAWAAKSGIGWMGKHTNIINREYGSWFFIANMITNFEFNYSMPAEDSCGSCTACIDACPTNAIVDEYLLDASKCISYLTIENKNEIPEKFKGKMDSWIFGCDICQDVCPWNKKFARESSAAEFFPGELKKEIPFEEILQMGESEFRHKFKESPVKRAKLSGLKRNASFIIEKF